MVVLSIAHVVIVQGNWMCGVIDFQTSARTQSPGAQSNNEGKQLTVMDDGEGNDDDVLDFALSIRTLCAAMCALSPVMSIFDTTLVEHVLLTRNVQTRQDGGTSSPSSASTPWQTALQPWRVAVLWSPSRLPWSAARAVSRWWTEVVGRITHLCVCASFFAPHTSRAKLKL